MIEFRPHGFARPAHTSKKITFRTRPEPAVVDTVLTTRILQAARGQAIELPVAIAIATGCGSPPLT